MGVSEFNNSEYREYCLAQGWGGYGTHYVLMSEDQLKKLHENRQKVGVGYISSKNSLIREWNRGIDWVFSNNALTVQNMSQNLSL